MSKHQHILKRTCQARSCKECPSTIYTYSYCDNCQLCVEHCAKNGGSLEIVPINQFGNKLKERLEKLGPEDLECVSDSTSAITGVGKFIREKLDGLDLSDNEADNIRSCQWCGKAILYSDRFCSQKCEEYHQTELIWQLQHPGGE